MYNNASCFNVLPKNGHVNCIFITTSLGVKGVYNL